MSLRLGLSASISCAHHLVGAGLCERPHGHTYLVEAEFLAPAAGWERLEASFASALRPYDHRDLNQILEFPSCENLCQRLAGDMESLGLPLARLKVWEGEGKWAQWEPPAER